MQKREKILLFGHSGTEDLRSKETAFGSLDNLLVDGLRWMVHHDGALFVVNLGVYPRIPDKIDYPFLALVL